ncbi:MAG: general secretion pathway protein K [Halieaceae bacterium]|jgi:general secretion pathway protein K
MYFPRVSYRRRRENGVALIVALLVFAISAALLVAMQREFTLDYRRGANRFIEEQSWAYLRGAEELATMALQLDYDSDVAREAPRDDLQELWAQEAVPYALDEGGWMFGSLQDLQGRFNLNSLDAAPTDGVGAAAYSPAQQAFIRLLQALDGLELSQYDAIAIAESVADWIDTDSDTRLNGAESSFYASLSPSYRPANRAMASVSELRAVANITPALYRSLAPLVSVWPRTPASINIHTAPLPVLRALNADGNLQPLSLADGETLLAQRADTGFADREEFLALPVFAGASLTGTASLIGESSAWFLLDSRVEIADREQRLYSVLRRDARQVTVLLRTGGGLYDLAMLVPETER